MKALCSCSHCRPAIRSRVDGLCAGLLGLAILLSGCAPLAIYRDLSRPYTKAEVLSETLGLETYRRCAEFSQRPQIADWDGATTQLHCLWRPAPEGDNPITFVFIHGYPSSLFTWAKIISPAKGSSNYEAAELLAGRTGLLAMDLPGHGFTEAARCGKEWRRQLMPDQAARTVVHVLDNAGLKGRVVFVGHSFGSLVAMAAASRAAKFPRPGRRWNVQGLVLIDPEGAHRRRFLSSEKQLRSWYMYPFTSCHWVPRNLGWVTTLCSKTFWKEGFWHAEAQSALKGMTTEADWVVAWDQRHSYARLMRIPENYYSNRRLVRWTGKPQIDLLEDARPHATERILIWGEADNLFPPSRDRGFFLNHVDPTHEVNVAGAGHMITEDNPGSITKALLDLQTRLSSP